MDIKEGKSGRQGVHKWTSGSLEVDTREWMSGRHGGVSGHLIRGHLPNRMSINEKNYRAI